MKVEILMLTPTLFARDKTAMCQSCHTSQADKLIRAAVIKKKRFLRISIVAQECTRLYEQYDIRVSYSL